MIQLPGKLTRYSTEFKEEAARMVVDSSRPIAAVAREIGVNETTLGFWVKAHRKNHAAAELPLDMPDRARLRELERRNRELEMELAFLKKAAAYFAREHR
jgi:transposase